MPTPSQKFLGREVKPQKLELARAASSHKKIVWRIICLAIVVVALSFSFSFRVFAAASVAPALPTGNCDIIKIPPPDPNKRTYTDLGKAVADGNIFPLIPGVLIDYGFYSSNPAKLGSFTGVGCVPSLWNRDIAGILIFKGLGLLNYFAGALAVLATIYAAILYLTSAVSEASAKKAKTILIGTYVGFLIVLGARLIVQNSFQLFGTGANLGSVLDTPS